MSDPQSQPPQEPQPAPAPPPAREDEPIAIPEPHEIGDENAQPG